MRSPIGLLPAVLRLLREEATPERTAFVRFRQELVRRGLDRALFDAVVRQLKRQGVAVKTGTLIDATVIGSASHRDTEAAWPATGGVRPFTATRLTSVPMPIPLWSKRSQ